MQLSAARARTATAMLAAVLLSLVLPTAAVAAFDPGGAGGGGSATAPQVLTVHLAPVAPAEAGGTVDIVAQLSVTPGWHLQSHQPSQDYLIPTVLSVEVPAGWAAATVRYPPDTTYHPGFSEEPLAVYEGDVDVVATLAVPAGQPAATVAVPVKLRYQACDDRVCLPPKTVEATAQLTIGGGDVAGTGSSPPASAGAAPAGAAPVGVAPTDAASQTPAAGARPPGAPRGLAWILLLGVLGGLILNVMPCVLPVLSLKVFGIVDSAGRGRSAVVAGSLATAGGILVSFWALAGAAIAARAAGAAVGWGVQFQEPRFVAFLAVIVVLFALNLWGLFEVPLPAGVATWAAGKSGESLGGHFASGLFATLMATPCSAPFLGSAVGFALGQSGPTVFAVFTAVGLGMALPYLALAIAPAAVKLLPRPGAWMETLRHVMGYLLVAAVVWLFYVLGGQVSRERQAGLQLALLGLGLVVWLAGRARGTGTRRTFWALALAVAVLAVVVVHDPAARANGATNGPVGTVKLIPWVPFDRTEAEALAAEGRLVFVDVTADWCFTCKVNERAVLETQPVADAFAQAGVVAMKADWTNHDPAIGDYIASFGRYGIPFYALYRPGQPPHLFPELLTQQIVLEVVRAAAPAIAAGGTAPAGI